MGENRHIVSFFFSKHFVLEFCCSVLHPGLGGEGEEGMFYQPAERLKTMYRDIERVG